MKVGDVIYRTDMPTMGPYRITGESPAWPAWTVESTKPRNPGAMKSGLVFKDDERWKKVE